MSNFFNKIQKKIQDRTYIDIATKSLQNARGNLKYAKFGKSIKEIREEKNNHTVIVGSGPSLRKKDYSIFLKRHRKKFKLIACDGSLRYLLTKKIIPDLVVTLDPDNNRIVRWFGDKSLSKKDLKNDDYFRRQDLDNKFHKEIATNKILIKIFDKYAPKLKIALCTSSSKKVVQRIKNSKAKIFWWNPYLDDLKKKNSLSRKLYFLNKFPLINSGGNVGSAAWMIADQVYNSKNIVLLGMDLAYYIDTPYKSTQYFDAISKIASPNQYKKFFVKLFNPYLKRYFYTDHVYFWYKKCFLEMIRNTKSKTFNCTGGGIVFGRKIKWTSFPNFCKKHFN